MSLDHAQRIHGVCLCRHALPRTTTAGLIEDKKGGGDYYREFGVICQS